MARDTETSVQIGTTPAPEQLVIKVTADGPYQVKGAPPIYQATIEINEKGTSVGYLKGQEFPSNATVYLCRCGRSKNAPFCDGSHKTAGVDLTETASFEPLLAGSTEVDGPVIALTDNEKYCAFARFCDQGLRIWNEVQRPGASHQAMATKEAHQCPSGRLLVWDKQSQQPIEQAETPSIGLIEDPAQECSGPLMVRGGIRVESASGRSYEVRNRQTLCRCGESSNKPFCDGTHASIKYRDGI